MKLNVASKYLNGDELSEAHCAQKEQMPTRWKLVWNTEFSRRARPRSVVLYTDSCAASAILGSAYISQIVLNWNGIRKQSTDILHLSVISAWRWLEVYLCHGGYERNVLEQTRIKNCLPLWAVRDQELCFNSYLYQPANLVHCWVQASHKFSYTCSCFSFIQLVSIRLI